MSKFMFWRKKKIGEQPELNVPEPTILEPTIPEFMILEAGQVFDDNKKEEYSLKGEQLEIFKIGGTQCDITDFSILLGNGRDEENNIYKWFTKTLEYHHYCNIYRRHHYFVLSASAENEEIVSNEQTFKGGVRPAVSYSSISSNISNSVSNINGIVEVEYGEYPQDIVSEKISKELEELFSNKIMHKTGKVYTSYFVSYHEKTSENEHIEYEYNGKKYIRFVCKDDYCERVALSDGRIKEKDGIYWIEVKPIKWLVDEKTDTAVSSKIICAGIPFSTYYDKKKFDPEIKIFMDKYLSKDIIPSKINVLSKVETKKEKGSILENLVQEINEIISIIENKNIVNQIANQVKEITMQEERCPIFGIEDKEIVRK